MTSAETTVQIATFELRLMVVDHPTDRRRWNGGPMPSEDANAALGEAVEAFETTIRDLGFEVVRTGYGVTATEATDGSG